MRCVEAWSMVIPWLGFPLANLLKRVEPTWQRQVRGVHDAAATQADAGRSSGLQVLDWPYVEGLRHRRGDAPADAPGGRPLRRDLPNQNGAPLRLVVPWKYGFKGIKSIVRISLIEEQPPTTLEPRRRRRVRLLRQRESRGRPPALEPGDRAPHRRACRQAPPDAALQRLRRAGGEPLRRHGPAEILLTWPRSDLPAAARYPGIRPFAPAPSTSSA